MNIEWLHYFLEASRQKSLSKASGVLNMTQPALSKQIRNLEEYLGVEIFKRSALGVELTKEGTLLLDRIEPLLHEFESLKKDLLNLSQLNSLRLGTLPSLASYYLPQKVTEMKRQGVQIEMTVLSTSGEIIGLLQSGAVDVGIVQNTTPIPKTYWSVDLLHEPFYAIIPAAHSLFTKDSVTLDELKDESLIVYPRQCDVRRSIIKAYQNKGLEPNLSVEVSFGESIPGFVSAGAGISILPEIIAKQERPLPLRAIPIDDFGVNRTISLVSPKPAVGKRLRRYFV
jgi:LysR family transcriptional regulator, transcription activator of glutamate synthase operon